MKTNLRHALLGVMILVQLSAPAYLVYSRESILHHGERILLRTRPVDPYDPFRGRYLMLGFKEDTAPANAGDQWESGQTAYVILEKDAAGFATAKALTRKRPAQGIYVKVKTRSGFFQGKVDIEYPFGQYFLSEKKAPRAETVYREHTAKEQDDAYAAVRVKQGVAALENLFIAGKPLSDFLR